jgi:hypothetical protein
MAPTRSLSSYVEWPQLASVLGLTLSSRALPVQIDCPLCDHGELHLYEDTIKDSVWHHCFACNAQGDLIELAASVWGLDTIATVEKLRLSGIRFPEGLTDEAIQRYEVDHLAKRQSVDTFWNAAKHRLTLYKSAELNAIRERFHLNWRGDEERWRDGPGHVLGAAHYKAVQKLLGKTSIRNSDGTGDQVSLFKGRSWGEVLVIPFHDLPDRISGFCFVGRQGRKRDTVWAGIQRPNSGKFHCTDEFGLAGLPAIATSNVNGPVVAVEDPLLLVRLKLRHAATANTLLPVVAWHDDRYRYARSSWKVLAGRRLVFWGWKLTDTLLQQAIRTDSDVSVVGPDNLKKDSINNYIKTFSSQDIYLKVVRHSLPWQEFLSRQIIAANAGWCEGLFIKLQRSGFDVASLVSQLRPKARKLLGNVLSLPPAARTITFGLYKITESNNVWNYTLPSNSHRVPVPVMLSNFVLRVDEVVVRDGEPYYRGSIRCGLSNVLFDLPQDVLEKGGMAALRKLMFQAGSIDVLYMVASHWGSKLLEIALAFHAPSVLTGPETPENPASAASDSVSACPTASNEPDSL